MKKLNLQNEVTVRGRDFWGRSAHITFTPAGQPGWFWRTHEKADPVAITPQLASLGKNNIVLRHKRYRLHFYEHIGVLRFLGIDGVIIESTPWPPYHGRSIELWEAVKEQCTADADEIRWHEIKRWCGFKYPEKEGLRYTHIQPKSKQDEKYELCIEIIADYPELGEKRLVVLLPQDIEIVIAALAVYSQGWPPWRYHLSRAASLCGWPHHKKTTWPQKHPPQTTIRYFAMHRLIDLLGALSMISNTELVSGQVLSCRSGHTADVHTIRSVRLK